MLDRFQAFRDQMDRERKRDAWLLANLLAPWSEKELSPKDFYDPGSQLDPAEKARLLRERAERMDRG